MGDPKESIMAQRDSVEEDSVFEDDEQSRSNTGEGLEDEAGMKKAQEANIAEKESCIVSWVRVFVIFLLLAVTAGVSVGVYYFVSNSETESFEEDYEDSSEKVLDSVGDTLDQTLGAVDNLMVSIVSHQEYSNTSFPFVTVPDFAVRAAKILGLGKASVIGVYPKVLHAQREEWENYTLDNDDWVDESLKIQREDPTFKGTNLPEWHPFKFIHSSTGIRPQLDVYYPTWQAAPIVPRWGAYNWDLYNKFPKELTSLEKNRQVVLGRTLNLPEKDENTINWISELIGENQSPEEPLFPFYYPIIEGATDAVDVAERDPSQHGMVGTIAVSMFWREIIKNILSPGSLGTIVVIGNDCNQTFSYQINGPEAVYLGNGDKHSSEYENMRRFAYLHELTGASGAKNRAQSYTGFPLSTSYCPYWIKTYPSDTMKTQHETNNPMIFTIVAVSIFVFTATFFIVYDCVSERRQKKVLRVAMQSSAVVSSLFPQVVRDRIFPSQENEKPKERIETAKLRLQNFLHKDNNEARISELGDNEVESPVVPIADLFSETTVLFLDIAGFTAWSSIREPSQVFTLLETLYSAYDSLAARRGVFKIETIGDSYVAACGVPDPNPDHALVMARFARDVREKTNELVKKLANALGPDTADLEVRIGLNSGPVTAGVLRGERSRFQLFGDTVNTAARMESTGVVSKIQASMSTAMLLRQAGKGHWVQERIGGVEAKGKGTLVTFWVEPTVRHGSIADAEGGENTVDESSQVMDNKTRRLVDWNVEIISRLLRQIVSLREARERAKKEKLVEVPEFTKNSLTEPSTVLEEVAEVIMLPEFDPAVTRIMQDPNKIELDASARSQLEEYVAVIASMYKDNAFHNFEHASHVTMSVLKLLGRIVAPTEAAIQTAEETNGPLESTLHDFTYGITSCPLTQFACVFSALIHDVDHQGVPNATLVKEGSALVSVYKGKSIAEQNSVDLSWRLLMQEQFSDLRSVICADQAEMNRFRQLVINAVMATDIMDKDLKIQRNARWEKAFSEGRLDETERVNTNRKATIVIEHLLQASDVAHTMQHWHIFRKWNEKLFSEMYAAYKAGRSGEQNPASFWFKGELGFFDFYVIPLAKKLSDCGVFGVASDEYLGYAVKNREEWEAKGREVVEGMVAKFVSPAPAAVTVTGNNHDESGTDGLHTVDKRPSSGFNPSAAEETNDKAGVCGEKPETFSSLSSI